MVMMGSWTNTPSKTGEGVGSMTYHPALESLFSGAGGAGGSMDISTMLAQILQQGPNMSGGGGGGNATFGTGATSFGAPNPAYAKPAPVLPGNGAAPGNMSGVDIQSQLAQLLKTGPQVDQTMLNASLGDINAQQTAGINELRNRFSGSGRPLSSTEYGSQETQLADTFNRSRTAARANASTAGLSRYTAQTNPLMNALQLMNQQSATQAAIGMNEKNYGLNEYNAKLGALMNLIKLYQSQ